MSNKRIFIVGARGQLGKALQTQYPNAQSADIDELDITNKQSVYSYDWSNIDIILNAAAFTNVDAAETTEGRHTAWNVNATAVSYLSKIASKHGIVLVHISTDYVFDGSQPLHSEHELFSPLSVYGASKAAGDIAVGIHEKHYIIRTSWVIGDGKNFVRTMLGLAKKEISPTVVSDQIGRLTFTSELVRAIEHLLSSKAPYGTYNVSNSGEPAGWDVITREVFKIAMHKKLNVTSISTKEYFKDKSGIAPRPLQSTLDLDKIQSTGFISIDWKEALKDYIGKELT